MSPTVANFVAWLKYCVQHGIESKSGKRIEGEFSHECH